MIFKKLLTKDFVFCAVFEDLGVTFLNLSVKFYKFKLLGGRKYRLKKGSVLKLYCENFKMPIPTNDAQTPCWLRICVNTL